MDKAFTEISNRCHHVFCSNFNHHRSFVLCSAMLQLLILLRCLLWNPVKESKSSNMRILGRARPWHIGHRAKFASHSQHNWSMLSWRFLVGGSWLEVLSWLNFIFTDIQTSKHCKWWWVRHRHLKTFLLYSYLIAYQTYKMGLNFR